jgi:glucokinase
VLNDFEAVGYGIPALGADDVVAINPGAKPLDQVGAGAWLCILACVPL